MIKTGELEIQFGPPKTVESPLPGPAQAFEALKKQEENLPPDLRADDLMNADKTLFWSSPDGKNEDMPLAGEQEL
jgi:hypothetical protein